MSHAYLFGDESGTMPAGDGDEPFVAAIVATSSVPEHWSRRSRNLDALVAKLKSAEAAIAITYILPRPGYSQELASKMSKMDAMARYRLLVTGRHGYLPAGGLPIRNTLWTHAVSNAIGQVCVTRTFRAALSSMDVLLDEKTLAPESRELFKNETEKIPDRLRHILASPKVANDHRAQAALANLRLTSGTVTIRWSDDPQAPDGAGGLALADRVASHWRRALIAGVSTLEQAFLSAGVSCTVMNLTEIVLAPLDRGNVEKWKRETGLPEPAP